ncbi:dihydroxyacetone kinase subunit DhaK [Lentisphaera profundi]|uniref:Dihydroxyacetone kinase subunit DhaK n=1 Tax=Lentisphaera profundi TaxID=1658616 RepID=A0ABY7VTM8_9BACT|nr:dihydroxyacetone kinase subunit DhaK [Lentisphaera profundi]WDE97261.1 dihydroxyacetone kinase subunit DhaK [Lentisphaera profundi]
MRKLINDPENLALELIDGFCLTNKKKVKRMAPHVCARVDAPIKGKVGIVIGGGAGHEPLFLEFIGQGMADASVHGQVFTAPTPDKVLDAIKAADSGEGVILLYNNYAGDVMNFDMGQDFARLEGHKVETVLINDEISAFPPDQAEERRGTTADHLVIHVAGAAAEAGMGFDDLKKLLERAVFNCRSLGVSTSECTLPETGLKTFELAEGRMEFGMGIHGEAGIEQVDLMTADETAERLIDGIIADLPFKSGDDVIALVNGYGATTRMEMFIVMRHMHKYIESKGMTIHETELGEFCTAQEMAGVSVTLMKLDDELKKYYDMPADSPGYVKV